jgi:hypothetical protein
VCMTAVLVHTLVFFFFPLSFFPWPLMLLMPQAWPQLDADQRSNNACLYFDKQ